VVGRESAGVFVAFKEIRRSIGRFSLLTFAVALLVLLLLFFQAVAGSLTRGLTGGLQSTSADVLVYDEQARRNPATSILATEVEAAVAAAPDVVATSPIGLSVFTGTTDGAEIDVQLVGGDPSGPAVPADVADGRLPAASGEALFSGSSFDDPIEIGQQVAVDGVVFDVVGTANDAAFNVLPTLYVRFEDYVAASQARAGAPIDVAPSLIGVEVADGADPASVARNLTESIEGVEALDRASAVDALPGVSTITQSFSILYLLLYIVVAIVTGVFFLILTVQKQDALVLLRAVGASSRDVIGAVLIQVVVVVGLGALIGSAVTGALLAATRDVFGAGLSLATTATTVAVIVVLGLLASIGAVRRVLAIDPVQATTHGGL
jgi:putative ABC transport system permease protein